MPIEYVSGDLFANAFDARAFAHGCNCQGSMGAGIAVGFRERYPEMFQQYRDLCKATPREFNLGDAWLWKDATQPWVFNLGTQEGVWRARASYDAIETALASMRTTADSEAVTSIAIPRIGVGCGGLSWKKVKLIVEKVFADWAGRLIVYEEFVPTESPTTPTQAAAKSGPTRKGPQFRVRAITISCTDIERSQFFYETVLGAKRLPTDVGTAHWYRLGTLNITLIRNAETASPAEFPKHAMSMLWLEVKNLSKTAQWLTDHKVTIDDEGDGQFMTIADPDGLLIEVWEQEPQ